MGVRQWVHLLMNVGRVGLTTHLITYRLKSALIRTMPWLQMQRPLQQLPHSHQIGGRLGKRTPNADLWRTQKLRRYEKPLTNRHRTEQPDCCMPAQATQPNQSTQLQQQQSHATIAIRNSMAMRARKSDLKQPLQVRDALVSRWVNYRHLSSSKR